MLSGHEVEIQEQAIQTLARSRRSPMAKIITDANGERVEAESQHDSTSEEKERRRELVRNSL